MKMLKNTILFAILISSMVLAQGKIFQPKEAEVLFGKPSVEKELSVDQLKTALAYTTGKIMFSIQEDQLFILGDNRSAITPTNKFLGKDVIVYSFSKTKIFEFLETNPDARIIKVQMRGSVLCLDNGVTVLEFALPCPPYCG